MLIHHFLGIQGIFPNLLPQCIVLSYADELFLNMVIDCHVVKDGDTMLPRLYLEEALALGRAYGVNMSENDMQASLSKDGVFSLIS